MPSSQMSEESRWKLPEDTLFPARLNKVEERRIDYTRRDNGEKDFFFKWEWEFEIIGGEYQGLKAWGDTDGKLTTHPQNKVRQWGEVLLATEFEVGQGVNTDDMLGLECVITVSNDTYVNKAGDTKYLCPVAEVFPKGADKGITSLSSSPGSAVADPNDPWANQPPEPPF